MTQNQPPIARKEHKETTLHGTVLIDDYAWLRDKQNPEVTAYLEAENAYAEAVMSPLSGLRDQLYDEMLSHMKQTDVSVPFRDGNWWYLTRTEEGKQYAIHCRKASRYSKSAILSVPGPGDRSVVLSERSESTGISSSSIHLSRSSSTAISWPRVTRSSPSAPPTLLAMAAGLPTPLTPPASASTRCT